MASKYFNLIELIWLNRTESSTNKNARNHEINEESTDVWRMILLAQGK